MGKPLAAFQSRFRLSQVVLCNGESNLPYVPRRSHTKSRGGCLACKKRKTKVRPSYHRCLDLEADGKTSVMSRDPDVGSAPGRMLPAFLTVLWYNYETAKSGQKL